jgi:hypothetical protein
MNEQILRQFLQVAPCDLINWLPFMFIQTYAGDFPSLIRKKMAENRNRIKC